MKNIHPKEMTALMALPGQERYSIFIQRVADGEEVWTLRTAGGFVVVADSDNRVCVPVWSHHQFAEAYAESREPGAKAEAIALERWMKAWIPGLIKDERGIAVFPVPSGLGVVVAPDQLHEDLLAECEQYE